MYFVFMYFICNSFNLIEDNKFRGDQMTSSITLPAYAKINLTLDVIGRRDNGYHDVAMIMQQISLFDQVRVKVREDSKICLTCSEEKLPTNNQNIAYKAAVRMIERYDIAHGYTIHIQKEIPISAGLGGGSTDAAAVIKAINQLENLNLSRDELKTIGFELGADVPFCIEGGCAIATGLGEILEPIHGLRGIWLVLVKPEFGVSTEVVYRAIDEKEIYKRPDNDAMKRALEQNNLKEITENLCNVLESVTIEMHPTIAVIKSKLLSYGAKAVLMSGSGPTVFGVFKTYDSAKKAYHNASKFYRQCFLVTLPDADIRFGGDHEFRF